MVGFLIFAKVLLTLLSLAVVCVFIAKIIQKNICRNDDKNPFEAKKVIFVSDANDVLNADGVKGHLEIIGSEANKQSIYSKYVKRIIDIFVSTCGLLVISPVLIAIIAAIKIDDPGPAFFTQKRIGQNKKYFRLYKFRSMKMCTPHDTPTHMLENPEQYITRVGKFLRSHSLDELPQLLNVLDGSISLVGVRPGLWNQDVLTAERDKYGVNELKPGITGWAQINGRDSISIEEKSKLDGYYKEHQSLLLDLKCLLGTVSKIGHDDTVVEGGTGKLSQIGRHYADNKSEQELIGNIGFSYPVRVDYSATKKVLITGANSYIGKSFEEYAKAHYFNNFEIDTIDMIDGAWHQHDFSGYDIVYHVAGIAHADVGTVDDSTKEKYYTINTDMAVEVAKKAKGAGVKEFIFMSSMIVYGDSAPYGKEKIIDARTIPNASNFYGDSKLQADVAVRDLSDEQFEVIVLRPPMIYGKGSKGNYPTLARLATKLPLFPNVNNQRSMLYIENLCEFLCQIMLVNELKMDSIVLFPQNPELTKTSEMVRSIAKAHGKKIALLNCLNISVWVCGKVPGKIGALVNKAFGNSAYSKELSEYPGINYQCVDMAESVSRTEKSR